MKVLHRGEGNYHVEFKEVNKHTANRVISAAADCSVSLNAVSSPKSSAAAAITDIGSEMTDPGWNDKSSFGAGTGTSGTGGSRTSAAAEISEAMEVRLASADTTG